MSTLTEIRPQGETYRQPAPPGVRNQVRTIQLRVEQLPEGLLRVSTPTAQGWAAVARTPEELTRIIASAFTEAQLAAYAAWRGQHYDLAELCSRDDPDPLVHAPLNRRVRRPSVRRDQFDPMDWKVDSEGMWCSPGGRRYRPDSTMVRRVIAARRRLGA